MKKQSISCFLNWALLLVFMLGYSQDNKSFHQNTRHTFAEKIYLQLSNTIFATGETIWFKAIVTNTLNQPSNISGILHMELIDFDENIVKSKKLKLENGITDSFFELDERLFPGRYLIRAYTTWNRNFKEDFIFKQYIDVVSLKISNSKEVISDIVITETKENLLKIAATIHPESIKNNYNKELKVYLQSEKFQDSIDVKRENQQYAFEYTLPKDLINVQLKVKLEDTKLKNFKHKAESTYSKTIALNKDFLDLQFFPEGGKMIDGFVNKVAYKAINYKGLGAVVSGYIVDETDSIITPFTTNKLGMGFTFFKPEKSKTYFGKIIGDNKVVYKYPLPKVESQGYLLNTIETKEFINLKIRSNEKNSDSLFVQLRSRGALVQKHAFLLKNGTHEALIKKSLLPNGIVNITLFNDKYNPISERLFFNFDEEKILNVTAKTNKKLYEQRDKTVLNISVFDNHNPVEANFSALILDKNKLGAFQEYQPNILSYFLLNSELKGFIENPNYYFKDDNTLKKRDLEALMLTQGWREYIYDNNRIDKNFEFKPESDLLLSGSVGSIFNQNKPPKKNVDLTLITKPPLAVYKQETDSLGKFTFNLGNHYADELEVLIQSTNSRGKAKSFNIELDKPIPSPKIAYERKEVTVLPDTVVTEFIIDKREEKRAVAGFKLSDDTVELDAVELTGYNVTPEREKLFKLHGPPDVVIENEELLQEEEEWMSGLYDLLRVKFPDDIYFENVRYPSEAFGLKQDPSFTPVDTIVPSLEVPKIAETNVAFVFIDGEIVEGIDYPLLPFLSVENIKSVEILRKPSGAVLHYFQEAFPRNGFFDRPAIPLVGIISIYTYGGVGMSALSSPKGIYKGKISGFSVKREFYAPKYDVLKPEDWDIPDLRSLIHWEPSIYTNKKGEAQIEFYNDDGIGDKKIIIEAITPDGKIGYYETLYTVEKKLDNN
ncbi:hypothetical protein [Seonamhaeicola aphaedonensis]|uniref:MG2 domain-containing protein n=1 Tax=Seonamhaeicola aphaedonensis TaxID=1461338 RepID=A0A3D9HHJ7_9FLAO|nr:hypothetical protein [Seonamhaeicola aphaedonensis]RED48875.1 hypothetical protein DFQ02_103206 [Seonamhaeicola aphaedonensis]